VENINAERLGNVVIRTRFNWRILSLL